MKTLTYKVVTENYKEYEWKFTLIKNENDYGTGNYVIILKGEELEAYVDVRYNAKFNIYTFVEKYLKGYYGQNLLSYMLITEIEAPF